MTPLKAAADSPDFKTHRTKKGRPKAAFPCPNWISSPRRASPRAATIARKAQAYEADEQHRPGRGLGNRGPEALGPQGLHRGGWMNVVPKQEAIDVLAVRTASRRRRRAPRRVGEAGVGRVREPESSGVGQDVCVEIVKVEVRERCAGGQRRIEGRSPAARSVSYIWLNGVASAAAVDGSSCVNSGMSPTFGTFTTKKCLAPSPDSVEIAANSVSTPAVIAPAPVPQRRIADVIAANHDDIERIRVGMVRYESAIRRNLFRQVDSGYPALRHQRDVAPPTA